MKAFNRQAIEDYRANGRFTGPLAGRGVLILTTMGAKSGRPQSVVVGYGKDGDNFVVIASNNGASEHPLWYRNLQRNPRATVEVGGEKFDVRARTAEPQERARLQARVPYLESQQQLTAREIPLVVLERAGT